MKAFRQARRWLLFWIAPLVMLGLAVNYATRGWWVVAALFGLAAAGPAHFIRQMWRERSPQE